MKYSHYGQPYFGQAKPPKGDIHPMPTVTTAVPTGVWTVEPKHSKVGFAVKHLGISTVRGEFKTFEGKVEVAEDGSVSASGTVDTASVDTAEADRDTHLRSADFFDVEKYPQITFQSTAIEPVDEDTFEIVGDLTLHGVTKPVTLTAEVTGTEDDPWGNQRVGLEVTGSLSRGDYEMKFNQALGSGNVLVSDKVKIAVDISAVKG
jgi:polyisoprenoid-binding protein YceI